MGLVLTLLVVILIFAVAFWIVSMIPWGPTAGRTPQILQLALAIMLLLFLILVLLGHVPTIVIR